MPPKKGKSQKTISGNIKEMAHGPHHADRVRKHGAKKAHEMEVAAAEHKAHPKRKGKR